MKRFSLCILVFLLFSCGRKTEHSPVVKVVNPFFDRAYEFLDKGDSDSSFFYFEQAKQVFLDQGDSLGVANCLIIMAVNQRQQNDYFGAQETALQALVYLDISNSKHRAYLSANYNNLGIASYQMLDYNQSILFFERAIEYSDDATANLVYRNNIALCYRDLGKFDESFNLFKELLKNIEHDTKTYARILTNYANAKWLQNVSYLALPEYFEGLKIRQDAHDLWGLNASYAQLSDYYMQIKPDSALYYARLQYNMAKQIGSADDKVKALQRLIKIHPVDSTKQYFEIYEGLTDSLQFARAAAKNQFALIRYESEKNKADIFRLEKENAEKARRLLRQRVITTGIVLLLISSLIGAMNYYKRRHQRVELEAANKIKHSQLKTSRKVHDVVANGIYRVMVEIEHVKDIDRNGILDKLEDMYYKSRDISYEAEDGKILLAPFHEQLMELLKSFSSSSCRVLIAGNEPMVWESLEPYVQSEISHVLQELMVNMKKHSQADHVVIRFSRSDTALTIHYQDSGVGLPAKLQHGKGMISAENRIKSLNGSITFVTEEGKGLKVAISIPLC